LNKRIRSRVLAAGVASSTLLGLGAFPFLQQAISAQDKPTASEQLTRGQRLFDQKQFADAKKVLLDIDPTQLPEDQRATLTELLKNTDTELSKAQGSNGPFDAAQANLDADKLAAAATGFQAVIDDGSASSDLKDKAKIQLALVRQKQADKAPQMKELLAQAQGLYDQGKLDESQNAVDTVVASGSDLGWQDNAKPALLQQKIADRRAALASGQAPAAPASADMTAPAPGSTAVVSAPPADMAAPAAPATPAAAPTVDPNSALGQTISADEIERQRALTLYNIAIQDSKDAVAATPPHYADAIERAHEAGIVIDNNRRFFSDSEANALRSAASSQEQIATAGKASFDTQEQERAQSLAKKNEADLAQKRTEEKRRRVDALMRDAQRFADTQQYQEAADTLRQIRIIDPTNSSAKLMLSLVTDRISYRQYETLVKDNAREDVRGRLQNAEEVVPYADLLVYPENWVDITRTRLGDQSQQDSSANRTARARLSENLKEIAADQQGLEKVINFLRDNTGTNIFVNWKALEAAGLDRNTPVSVSLRDVPFSKALTTILASVGGTANLSYTVDDGVITISTRDDLLASVPPRVSTYDIRDLLVQPDNSIPPNLDTATAAQSGSAGGGGGQSLFGNTQGSQNAPNADRDVIVKSITDAIIQTVAPETWRDNGGSIGTIREISGELLITQTVDNQLQIESLLDKIRETHAVMISIESRILLVNNNFFEQFGLGWNLSIPAGSLGSAVGAVSATNNTLAETSALGGSSGILAGNFTAANGASAGLNVTGSILDNFQLSLLIQATQADQRTVSIAAPRVTIFNGQQGYITVENSQGYVSNFQQTISQGNVLGSVPTVATTLTTSTLPTGVELLVQAAVSADHRYVIMQVTPTISTNLGFTNFGTPANAANGELTGTLVQLPNVDITTIHSTVSVPDGATLLLGGEKVIGQSELEIGVPILSKIPGLNRLFTNRVSEKDERTLLILIRPKIIIQKEIENNLYGPGYDRPTGQPTNSTNQSLLDGNGIDPGFRSMGH
jgi:type II secretory pathway component GspD/PulD (secretin)